MVPTNCYDIRIISKRADLNKIFGLGAHDSFRAKISPGMPVGFKKANPVLNPFPAVGFFPGRQNSFYGDVRIYTVIVHIFHKPFIFEVIGLKNRIFVTVEFEGFYMVPMAEFLVEGGR